MKLIIKNEKATPFDKKFFLMDGFDRTDFGNVIDNRLGLR